jgi:hypothetical protein
MLSKWRWLSLLLWFCSNSKRQHFQRFKYKHKSGSQKRKTAEEEGRMLHIASISLIISNLLKKTRKLILTHQLQVLTLQKPNIHPY